MNAKTLLCSFLVLAGFLNPVLSQNNYQKSSSAATQTVTINIFNQILFYDGYATTVNEPVPEGVIRHSNSLYAKKITESQLQLFGNKLTLNVTVKASCDNYDRIGNVNLAFVPKGESGYTPANVKRIEIARFITPFMNKNVTPDEVPYSYAIDNVAKLLKDRSFTSTYDIWVELELFGVPYAANTQVAGCSGRNDVFYGTLDFITGTDPTIPETAHLLVPLLFKSDFNNYNATDVPGQTVRMVSFNVPSNVNNAKLYLICSNHGANSGGEEYNRRTHYVYFDNTLKLNYIPGSASCEPFRKYNTQANGIYGYTPRSDAQWQSFSNWCPGDVIPTRAINLGSISSGTHTFKMEVPNALFVNKEGNFPLSVYLQAEPESTTGLEMFEKHTFTYYPNPTYRPLTIESNEPIESVALMNLAGQQVWKGNSTEVDMASLPKGVYIVQVRFADNQTKTGKIVKR